MAIGGTVSEIKRRMTYREFLMWDAYRQKRGTFNEGMRMEYLMARISFQLHKANGGTAEFEEFLRHHEPDAVTDVNELAKLMGVREVRRHGNK